MSRQLLNEIAEEVIREQKAFQTTMDWEVNRMVMSLGQAQLEEATGLKNQTLEDTRDVAIVMVTIAVREANEN